MKILSFVGAVAGPPSISMEFSADRALSSSKFPDSLSDVFLIVRHRLYAYALTLTQGKMKVVHSVTLLPQWLSDCLRSIA